MTYACSRCGSTDLSALGVGRACLDTAACHERQCAGLRDRAGRAEAGLALIAPHLPAVLDALRSRITDERWESQKTRFRDAKAALEALGGTRERSDGKETS